MALGSGERKSHLLGLRAVTGNFLPVKTGWERSPYPASCSPNPGDFRNWVLGNQHPTNTHSGSYLEGLQRRGTFPPSLLTWCFSPANALMCVPSKGLQEGTGWVWTDFLDELPSLRSCGAPWQVLSSPPLGVYLEEVLSAWGLGGIALKCSLGGPRQAGGGGSRGSALEGGGQPHFWTGQREEVGVSQGALTGAPWACPASLPSPPPHALVLVLELPSSLPPSCSLSAPRGTGFHLNCSNICAGNHFSPSTFLWQLVAVHSVARTYLKKRNFKLSLGEFK